MFRNPQLDVVCKFSAKKYALERVGVYAMLDDKPYVVEYSIIGDELAQKKNEKGELYFNHSNLLNFMMRVKFLEETILRPECLNLLNEKYNFAIRDVAMYDVKTKQEVETKGIKLEIFIHESFSFTDSARFLLLECDRDQEFAPIKNRTKDSAVDNPDTARCLYSQYHQWLLERVGYRFDRLADAQASCFVDPRLSYDGENLPEPQPGMVYSLPFYLK